MVYAAWSVLMCTMRHSRLILCKTRGLPVAASHSAKLIMHSISHSPANAVLACPAKQDMSGQFAFCLTWECSGCKGSHSS